MIAGLTVADLARPSERRVARLYDAVLIVGGSLVVALGAQIAVGDPVPITGQTFAVLIVADAARGATRRPVHPDVSGRRFAGSAGLCPGKGRSGHFSRTYGRLSRRFRRGGLPRRGFGPAWLGPSYHIVDSDDGPGRCGALRLRLGLAVVPCASWAQPLGARSVLAVGLYPFLGGEVVKIALAMALLPCGWKMIGYFGLDRTADIR